jgi:UDP-N-acetylglucosamine transferase subunit ALG13
LCRSSPMMFVTVGTQLPFDRLIKCIDRWAGSSFAGEVVAQIGPARWKPSHLQWVEFVGPEEFRRYVETADAVVSHAGMGSIITALELGKPILVMPRRADLGEHRNDHQMATARRFHEQGRIEVAFDETELLDKLAHLDGIQAKGRIAAQASSRLVETIRAFIAGEDVTSRIR